MEFTIIELLAAFSLEGLPSTLLNILYVVLGLGLVIVFHELGHFAVAKWCDVHVERFSIGFGPILWSRKKGETEYALSAIPFGGYVKMLGQDDMDPSQLSSEEISRDPRSYSAKSVPQRMAIISAGVIMNVITGLLFFAAAFGIGVETAPPAIGLVQAGKPAWVAGIEPGDRFTRIDDRRIDTFSDIMRGVALSAGPVTIDGVHHDGRTYEVTVNPDTSQNRRMIGAGPALGLRLIEPRDANVGVASPGTPAADAQPRFLPGDTIRKLDGREIADFVELETYLADNRASIVNFFVERKQSGKLGSGAALPLEKIEVAPRPFRTLGLWVDIGEVAAIQDDSPAARANLRVGDKLSKINGKVIGTDIDPVRLPDYLEKLAGQEVEIVVSRPIKGADRQDVVIRLVPDQKPGWLNPPIDEGIPLAIPAIGVAYHLVPAVLKVKENGPAARAGLIAGEQIERLELVLPEGEPADLYPRQVSINFESETGRSVKNWSHAFWMMQALPTHHVRLTVIDKLGKERRLALNPEPATDWFVPDDRGIRRSALSMTQRAEHVGQAIVMGLAHTTNTITDIYLTLRSLLARRLSYKELHGPLGIARVAYEVARQGLAELLLFLGFLSVNLAVLNFLPIPVLDGGHMIFLCWEAVTRKRPSERVLIAATYFGMAFVLGLMILVLYLDIFEHGLGVN